jgi:hypothetical protein
MKFGVVFGMVRHKKPVNLTLPERVDQIHFAIAAIAETRKKLSIYPAP